MSKKILESESVNEDEKALPILTSGIGTRIFEISERFGEKKRLSEVTGISEAQLYRYIKETSAPTIEPLARLAEAAGVYLEWLATGKGPKLIAENRAQTFDVETLQAAIETLEKGLEIMGRTVDDPAAKAQLIAQVYAYLADDSQDANARSTAVLGLLRLVK